MTLLQPDLLARVRELVEPALRAAIDRLEDPRLRTVAGYQLGWLDAGGEALSTPAGGKAIRPTLAVLGAEAVGADASLAVPGAVAVELVHNFSLLHDDIMDQDIERRHRPTGWVVFGAGSAMLAGNAMVVAAVQEVARAGTAGRRAIPVLLTAVQDLIRGQSEDLALENAEDVDLEQVQRMEAGKTAALLSCAASIGAVCADADDHAVAQLAAYGHELGLAFQLIDDVLGIVGDSTVTGKSSSSDIRAGKRSAPIVAALSSDTAAGEELAVLLAGGPLTSEADIARATQLVDRAGGLDWAHREAERHLAAALACLDAFEPTSTPVHELAGMARYVVGRDR